MLMKKILEVNANPQLTSYVHHAYTNSIIDKSFIASFFISDMDKGGWRIQDTDILYACDEKEGMVRLSENKGRSNTFFEMRRQCRAEDEVIVKLINIKLVDALSYVRMGIGGKKKTDSGSTVGHCFHWNQYDITTENGHISYEDHFNLYYKLARKNNDIQISVSKNAERWDVIYECTYELSMSEEHDFYVQVYFGENQYEQWVNMNYIQLFFDETDPNTVYLDYFMFPRKGDDASYQYLCHFLDTEYIDYQKYKSVEDVNIHKYIRGSILQDYYVNVCLNEFYIRNRRAYNSYKDEHYNLVYGFDDNERLYYILGYNANGKIETATVPYDVLENSISDNDIVRYRYKVNKWNYCFQIDYVRKMLQEYINGEDSSRRFKGLLENRKGVYGIKIFDQLIGTEFGKRLIVEDRRVSFVLYEHCKLMQKRLIYINKMGCLRTDDWKELFEKCELMVNTSEVLKNLVIKNSVRPRYKDNILGNLTSLKTYEVDFLECFLKSLKC